MRSQIAYALANPVFDPTADFTERHFWRIGDYSFGLSANIGLE